MFSMNPLSKQAAKVTDDAAGSNAPNPMAALAVQFLPFWLPPVAGLLQQQDEKKSEISRVGVQERDEILPLCEKIRDRLSTVPEAEALRPAVEAFIDGSDPDHLGEFVADLLQAFASSSASEAVKAIVLDLLSRVMSVPALQQASQNIFGATSNPMAALMSGVGSGNAARASAAPTTPMAGLMQGAFGGQGSQAPAPAEPSSEKIAELSPSYEIEVQDLLDMGLVSDAASARDLLHANDGDIARVVDSLTA
eukprot:gb/GFBE01044053.1/.p1 GENE.gb/GFBE01044053.1/~~gb/GFBE01044053.1/.p1  ORF type:complete len:251 (+),score=71.32 gb/GFBE01044053.1/:1-753(+)